MPDCSVLSIFKWCPKTDYCCCECCCSVKAGSIIIGVGLILYSIVFIAVNAALNGFHDLLQVLALSTIILALIVGFLLLIGVCGDLMTVVKISLILILVIIALFFVVAIVSLVALVNEDSDDRFKAGAPVWSLIGAVVYTVIFVYFFIIIFSHYRDSTGDVEK